MLETLPQNPPKEIMTDLGSLQVGWPEDFYKCIRHIYIIHVQEALILAFKEPVTRFSHILLSLSLFKP